MTYDAHIRTPVEGYMTLARAIILQAVKDAQKGDVSAALYLTLDGADLADTVNIDPAAIRRFITREYGWPLWAIQPMEVA